MATMRCPVKGCQTALQPYKGSLVDGVAAHLAMVHGFLGPRALRIAETTLTRPGYVVQAPN